MAKIKLVVPDISCNHCAMRIQKALAPLVSNVHVDIQTKEVTFEYGTEQELVAARVALDEIGYPPSA